MITKKRAVGALVAAAATLALVTACKRQREHTGEATVTAADVQASIDAATLPIAQARCERDLRCDDVRPERRHTSRETCIGLVRAEVARQLDPSRCPRGVDSHAVATCASSSTEAGCFDAIGGFMRLADCNPSRLCL